MEIKGLNESPYPLTPEKTLLTSRSIKQSSISKQKDVVYVIQVEEGTLAYVSKLELELKKKDQEILV